MPPSKQFDVLGLGAVAVDDVIYVEAYPPPDEKARVIGRQRRCGGLTAISLITAARLGAKCAYAGVLGRDKLSRFALSYLKQQRINVSKASYASLARPIHSNIVVDQRRGTRNIFFDLNHVVGASLRVPASVIQSCRVLFLDHVGVPGMIRAAHLARRAGIPTVADFERDNDPQFGKLLALTDHLILSRDFAARITGKSSPEKAVLALARTPHEVVIVTCGQEGFWYLARGLKTPRQQNAFKVKPLDTTGCGDVFHGAYAFGLARNLPLKERLTLAAVAAALKASGESGPKGIPTLSMVRQFMKQRLPG